MKMIIARFILCCVLFTVSACDRNSEKLTNSLFNMKSALLATVPQGYESGETYFSPDGQQVVQFASKDGHAVVIHKGTISRNYAAVLSPVFSKHRGDLAYIAVEANKQRIVVNGVEGKVYDAVGKPFFAPDGRIMYAAKLGEKWLIVAGSRTSVPFEAESPGLILNGDGTRLAYVGQRTGTKKAFVSICSNELDGCASGQEYDTISEIRTDRSGARFFFISGNDSSKAVVWVDPLQSGLKEHASTWYDEVFLANMADDGEHLAYVARKGDRTLLVKDRVEVTTASSANIFDLVLSKNDRTLHTALLKDKVAAFVDGKQVGKQYEEITAPSFNQDGSHFVYAVTSGLKSFIVVDGVEGDQYDKVVSPRFSPDGSRILFRARKDGARFAVIADLQGKTVRELPHYEAVWDLNFSPDGKTVGYGVKQGKELRWQVEKL